jgi:hypothetical protein
LQAAFAVLLILSPLQAAQAQDPYRVEAIDIDASAANTFEAQTDAMRQGQREAALRLIRRLALPEDLILSQILELEDTEVAELISGIEVLDERRSSTRYLATLNVSFDPRSVERLFAQYELEYVEVQARPALVLPILSTASGSQLWSGNPFMNSWREMDFSDELTPYFAPPDSAARQVLSPDQALRFEEERLRAVAANYSVTRLAVVLARDLGPATGLRPDAEGEEAQSPGRRYEVIARVADFDRGEEMVTYDWGPVEVSGGYEDIARTFVVEQANIWKRDTIVRGGALSELPVTVLYAGLGEWRAMQEILAGASLVEAARLDAMSRDGALMTLSYRGEQEQLRLELAERGAALEEHPGLGWVVRSTR